MEAGDNGNRVEGFIWFSRGGFNEIKWIVVVKTWCIGVIVLGK